MIAVATLGCDRKAAEGFPSWPFLYQLEGDYHLYFNYEDQTTGSSAREWSSWAGIMASKDVNWSFDIWRWGTTNGKQWRKLPKFDQDQARLASIVCARNMCIEFAMQTDASHLLFIDADIIPPLDIIPKLLEVNEDAVAGLVHGRGAHRSLRYVFQEKRKFRHEKGFELIEAEHANIGFTMISKRLFEATRFRWGTSRYPDGRVNMTSDDPAFHLDSFLKFGKWMYIRTDVVGQHIGELRNNEVAQF